VGVAYAIYIALKLRSARELAQRVVSLYGTQRHPSTTMRKSRDSRGLANERALLEMEIKALCIDQVTVDARQINNFRILSTLDEFIQ
jgi:hypothetical protein